MTKSRNRGTSREERGVGRDLKRKVSRLRRELERLTGAPEPLQGGDESSRDEPAPRKRVSEGSCPECGAGLVSFVAPSGKKLTGCPKCRKGNKR